MQAFSTVPGENSILISFQETLTDDIVISHNYFVEKEDPCRSDYYHRPFATSLLDIPIETLLENHQLREESSVKKPLPQVETKSTFSRPLLEDFDKVDNKLWGDKYQVSKYFDLVTDDSLNRESLLWLQTWNEVVFGFESKSSVFGIKPEKPPLKPLLLISGPPGSGKTTLAKVISHHFNYAPHEINCALLGSGKDLLDTLKNSLSIKTVSGKPGILILDQVESIDRATTKALCEILSNKTLKRPTIAITNDLYTSSLIPLRQIAQVMHSKFLSNENLYQRLKEICSNERVYVPEDLLRSLIKENKSDIRACVNTLQLLSSSRSDKQLNVDSSAFRVAGTKEVNLSVFEIWRTVFTEQNSKNVKKAVLSYGDPELINSGIHECYLNSRYSDLSLSKSLTMAESLSFNDVVSRRIRENQQFELYTYQAV
jgi:chromosome transmission fidelity protein 18